SPQADQTSQVKADPPEIFSSEKPAILINFDGDPVWSQIEGTELKYALNTNWDCFQLAPDNTIYLRNGATWLKASGVKGPWSPAATLPADFNKLPTNGNFKEALANLPGQPLAANKMPHVFVSFKPAEMILFKGPPQYTPVKGTSILWVSNTESNLFRQ